jgi:hypothetical protein
MNLLLPILGAAFAGDLRVDSKAEFVVVSLDGRLVGTTPLELPKLEGGEHELGFWSSATDGRPTFVRHITIPEDGALRVEVDFEARSVLIEDLAASPTASASASAPTSSSSSRSEPVTREPREDKAPEREPRPERTSGGGKGGRLALDVGVTAAGLGLGGVATWQYLQAREAYASFLSVPADPVAESIYEEEVAPARLRAAITGGAAVVALGTSAALWATTDLSVAPTPGGFVLSGSF